MTLNEWNELKAGDIIQCPDDHGVRYKILELEEEDFDEATTGSGKPPVLLRWFKADPLLHPSDPYWPDLQILEPGEAEDWELVTEPVDPNWRREPAFSFEASGQPPPPPSER
jgi:hypothetical protein